MSFRLCARTAPKPSPSSRYPARGSRPRQPPKAFRTLANTPCGKIFVNNCARAARSQKIHLRSFSRAYARFATKYWGFSGVRPQLPGSESEGFVKFAPFAPLYLQKRDLTRAYICCRIQPWQDPDKVLSPFISLELIEKYQSLCCEETKYETGSHQKTCTRTRRYGARNGFVRVFPPRNADNGR